MLATVSLNQSLHPEVRPYMLRNSMELNQEATIWAVTPINRRSLMPKPRYKTTNWKLYNKALINRGSLTFWIDEEAIAEWKQNKQGKRGRPRRFSDLAITTALMVKRVFWTGLIEQDTLIMDNDLILRC